MKTAVETAQKAIAEALKAAGAEVEDKYAVTVEFKGVESPKTKAVAAPNPAAKDAKVTVTVTKGEDEKVVSVTAKDAAGEAVTIAKDNTFAMPASAVTVTVTVEAESTETPDADVKAKVTFDTDGSLKADIYKYQPMGQALSAESIAAALSQENYPGTTTKLTVSAADVDLTKKTAKDSTSGETIKLGNVQALPTKALVKVTYPGASGSKEVYVCSDIDTALTGVKSGVTALMEKPAAGAKPVAAAGDVTSVNDKGVSEAINVDTDTEYVAALQLAFTPSHTTGTVTVDTNKNVKVGYVLGTNFTALNTETYIQAGVSLAVAKDSSKMPDFGEQVVVTIGESKTSLPVEKDAEGNNDIKTKTIQITEDMVDATTKTVKIKLELKKAVIPVYYDGKLLENVIDDGTDQKYMFKVDANVSALVYVDGDENLQDSSATISNGVATYTVDPDHAVDGKSIKLLPAYEVTGNASGSNDYELYAELNEDGDDVETKIDDNGTLVLASAGKVYLKAAAAHVIVGITDADSKAEISKVITAPSLAVTGEGNTTVGIWEITLGGDLNIDEFDVIASTKSTAKGQLTGAIAAGAEKEVTLSDIVISKDCTVEAIMVPVDGTGADKLTMKVGKNDDGDAIVITVTNPAADKGGAEIAASSDSTPKKIADFRVQLTVDGKTYTIMVPFNLAKAG